MSEIIILPSDIYSTTSDSSLTYNKRLTNLDIFKDKKINIHEIYISNIPKQLKKMYISIGNSVIYNFSRGELIKAQRLNSNILNTLHVDTEVIVPTGDAYYMHTDIQFVFDKESIMEEELTEMIDEYIDIPHYGNNCTIYQGNIDDPYIDDEYLYSGVIITYTKEKTGNIIKKIIGNIDIKTPLIKLVVKESTRSDNYNINFWERIIINPSVSNLYKLIDKFKLTPIYLKNIEKIMLLESPFTGKVINYIKVDEHMAGKAIIFTEF